MGSLDGEFWLSTASFYHGLFRLSDSVMSAFSVASGNWITLSWSACRQLLIGEARCRFPGAPAHSSVFFSNESLGVGTVATYTCERGFELLGPSRRVCDKTGQWVPEGIPFCVLNVAAGKAPMQISSELAGVPQKAIDGSTSSFFSTETCTLTKPEPTPWWYVNLLEPYMVQLVRLDFGKACCGKNKPATIIVRVGNNRPDLGTNPVCNRFTGFLEEGKPLFLPCNPPMPGAFVSVHLETTAGQSQLSICEAFVYTDQALPIERCPQFRDQPPGSTATYNGKCYIFYNRQPLNLRDALAFCRSRGGTLVDESNPALQGFISWELWRRHRSDTSSQYWMGAVRDPQDKMNWKWLNGDDVTISFWNLPGGNEDCARYDGSKGWLWSDTNCNIPINYICQHQPKTCGKPEQPPNSTMIAENFNVGSVIEYSCDEGHLLVGPNTRVCLPTGFYNEFPPVCKKVHCGYPADIPNGGYNLLNGTVGYLSQVMYYCNEGYKITGRALLTCDIDERWDGPPPRCQPVRCPDPPTILNGEAFISSNTTVAGTVIEFSCNRRFKLVGAKQLVCLPSGVYDNKPPVCKEDLRPVPGLSLGPVVTPTKSSSTAAPSTTPRERPRPFSTKPISTVRPRPSPIPPLLPVPEIEDNNLSESGRVPNIAIASSHPTDNEIPDSVHVRNDLSYNAANVPVHSLEEDHKETLSSKFNNLGAIILLGLLGGLVFLAAVIVTVVILVRRNRSAKHYRHRPSPDCHTVASFDSSSSESRNGLNRYYQQAWENLHQSASNKAHAQHARRKDMDPRLEGMRDGSELVVSDVATVYPHRVAGEKKRHHHHHHHNHHGAERDWRHHHPSAKHRY
ncbi:CUB and sushi domain-containing protein 1 isoform X2 [Bemisia tabaci]|uniref:CUB and sushi domain-containing protein 1 isoform X2 n=1 Tax=Bemisia tabaci TaxID=7038 RepID=UPI003B27B9C2